MKIERIKPAEGHGDPESEQLQVRMRLTTEEEREWPGATVWRALRLLSLPQRVHLELWDHRAPVREALTEFSLEPVRLGDVEIVLNVATSRLPEILDRLAPASFGLWLGLEADVLPNLIARHSTSERARALPMQSAFVIASIYDDNVEVFARVPDPAVKVELLSASG